MSRTEYNVKVIVDTETSHQPCTSICTTRKRVNLQQPQDIIRLWCDKIANKSHTAAALLTYIVTKACENLAQTVVLCKVPTQQSYRRRLGLGPGCTLVVVGSRRTTNLGSDPLPKGVIDARQTQHHGEKVEKVVVPSHYDQKLQKNLCHRCYVAVLSKWTVDVTNNNKESRPNN